MFSQYFAKKNELFVKAWNKYKKDAGKKKSINYEPIIQPIREFFGGHLPNYFKTDTGSALDSFGHRVNNMDILIYYEYHPNIWEMMNKAAVIEHIFGAILVIPKITSERLISTLDKAISFKKLSLRQPDLAEGSNVRKIPVGIFAFESEMSYSQLKDFLINYHEKSEVVNAYEVDIIASLNQFLVVKDWHWRPKRIPSCGFIFFSRSISWATIRPTWDSVTGNTSGSP
jgi:hypothetical protein